MHVYKQMTREHWINDIMMADKVFFKSYFGLITKLLLSIYTMEQREV